MHLLSRSKYYAMIHSCGFLPLYQTLYRDLSEYSRLLTQGILARWNVWMHTEIDSHSVPHRYSLRHMLIEVILYN